MDNILMNHTTSNNSDSVPFHYFCKVLENIQKTKTTQKKTTVLLKFINSQMNSDAPNFFPIMRLLVPQTDRERGPYGMKEINLARTYIRILSLASKSFEAERLLNFTTPSKMTSGATSDFAEVVSSILTTRCGKGMTMSVGEVNQSLDNVANKHAAHDPRGVDDEFKNMVMKMSSSEHKWLIRIIIKDMNLGLGLNKILSLYHSNAVEVYEYTNSIFHVCTQLTNRNIRPKQPEITLFQSFRAMLCGRADVHTFNIQTPHYVETKYDGERFQLHYREGQFKYFSRNGYEYTENYGCTSETGYLTSMIEKQLINNLLSFVLDGEMMCWHQGKKTFVTKAHNTDVKKLKVGKTLQPCFCVFDVVIYNGNDVTEKPLHERIKMLQHIFTPLDGVIMFVKRSLVSTSEEVFEALNFAIDNCEEGIVLKDPNSTYVPNSRTSGWYKMKPDYSEGTEDLDLLIIGGYYGVGRMTGQVSHFILGVAVEESDNPETFLSVAKVSLGLSDSELADLGVKLNPHWLKLDVSNPPQFLLFSKEKPDVYITPRCSLILQVKSPEVIKSNDYRTGYTLRFPRVVVVRYDKLWSDCLWIGEFNKLRTSAEGKLTAGHIIPRTKRKRKIKDNPGPSEPPVKVEKVSNIFNSKEICVMSGTEKHSRQELECLILGNGGKVIQQPGSSTYCVVYGSKNVRIQNVIKAKKHNVTTFDWLLQCILDKTLVPWDRLNLESADLKTELLISEQYDVFGDSYTEMVTSEKLNTLFNSMPSVHQSSPEDIKAVDECLFNGISPFSIFRNIYAYFDLNEPHQLSVKNAELLFKFSSGKVCFEINKLVNFIVMDIDHLENLKGFQEQCLDSEINCNFVSHNWILDSFKIKKLEDHANYLINYSSSNA